MSDALHAAREQIAENPSEVVINGQPTLAYLSPVESFDTDEGANPKTRRMVSISESPPTSPVGVDGEGWTVTDHTDHPDGVTLSTLTIE